MATANIDIRLSNGQQAGKTINELRQQANRLTKEVNNLKPGTDEFIKKSADLKQVGARLGEVRKEAKGVTEANNGILSSLQQFIPFNGQLKAMAGGVRSGVTAFKSLRVAIAATGIGLLVLAITALVTWFQRTEKGAQTLRVIMAGLGQITDSLMDVLTNLGEAIYNAFNNPKQTIQDLGKAIKEFVIDKFELMLSGLGKLGDAFSLLWEGKFKAAAKSAGEGVTEFLRATNPAVIAGELLFDGVKKTAEEAKKLFAELQSDAAAAMVLAKQENDLKVKNRAFLVEEAGYRAKIAELREFATDVTRTDVERQAALAKAIELSNEVESKKIALKAEQLRILKAQQEISITDEAGYEKAAQLEAELIGLQEARASSMRRLTAQESALRESINTAREAEIAKARAQEETALKNIQDLRIDSMEEGLNKEIEKLWLDTDRKIEALVGTEEQITEQKILLEDARLAAIEGVRQKYRDKEADNDKKLADKKKEEAKKITAFFEEQAAIKKEAEDDLTNFLREQLFKQIGDSKEAKNIKKALLLTEIGIRLISELTSNAKAAAENPLNGVTYGAAGAAQLAATNLASIARATLATGKALALEKGGLLQGPRHSQGGIPAMVGNQPIEMEGGEFVFSRKATAGIGADVLANINRKFEFGGPVNPLADRAPIPSTSSRTSSGNPSNSNQNNELLNAFMAYANKVDDWQRNLKVTNNLQESKKGLETLNKLESDASV